MIIIVVVIIVIIFEFVEEFPEGLQDPNVRSIIIVVVVLIIVVVVTEFFNMSPLSKYEE